MKAAIFAIVLLAVHLAVNSAPAADEESEGDQESFQPENCRQYLSPKGKSFIKHVLEDDMYQKEILKAGHKIEDDINKIKGQDLAGLSPEEVEAEEIGVDARAVEAIEVASEMHDQFGYNLVVDPNKVDTINPEDCCLEETPPDCKEVIQNFMKRNMQA